jgi:transcriptional regulator with XRE-family HTH domain
MSSKDAARLMHFARSVNVPPRRPSETVRMADDQNERARAEKLGLFLKTTRQGLDFTLRDVEEITGEQVSNAYLSQLENGKILKPSAHVLHILASVYRLSYEEIMKRAGYISPSSSDREATTKHGQAATFAIDNLDADEERELLEYLSFLRSRRRRNEQGG